VVILEQKQATLKKKKTPRHIFFSPLFPPISICSLSLFIILEPENKIKEISNKEKEKKKPKFLEN